MGGGKGGADFDPKENQISNAFCKASWLNYQTYWC
jgi:glutamate dehydrogenase/leucine dehydrogenase